MKFSLFQNLSAWLYEQHISILTSLHSVGSVRGVSWVLLPPRPHPLLAPILKVSFRPIASVNCRGVSWKTEAQKCGSVFTTLPWSNQSPVKHEVRNRIRKCMSLQEPHNKKIKRFFFLFFSVPRLHQETVCVWNHQLYVFHRSDFEPGVWNYRFLPPKCKCYLAEAQRWRPRWWRRGGGGDRGRRDLGSCADSPQALQGHCHTEEKGHKSGDKRERRGCDLQGGTLFSAGINREALEKHWPWYSSFLLLIRGSNPQYWWQYPHKVMVFILTFDSVLQLLQPFLHQSQSAGAVKELAYFLSC